MFYKFIELMFVYRVKKINIKTKYFLYHIEYMFRIKDKEREIILI